jgi:hypothetical protein
VHQKAQRDERMRREREKNLIEKPDIIKNKAKRKGKRF